MLQFSTPDLDTIASCYQDDRGRCDALLSQWLQGRNDQNDKRPKTWKTLLCVMRDARLGELANKLENIMLS